MTTSNAANPKSVHLQSTAVLPPEKNPVTQVEVDAVIDEKQESRAFARPARPMAREGWETDCLAVDITSMDAMMDVMTTVARLGAKTQALTADSNHLKLAFQARPHVARRLPMLVDNLPSVLGVRVNE
ncbi:MAG: hypothetical protein AAF483_16635 [Planctomycetota bacterium]